MPAAASRRQERGAAVQPPGCDCVRFCREGGARVLHGREVVGSWSCSRQQQKRGAVCVARRRSCRRCEVRMQTDRQAEGAGKCGGGAEVCERGCYAGCTQHNSAMTTCPPTTMLRQHAHPDDKPFSLAKPIYPNQHPGRPPPPTPTPSCLAQGGHPNQPLGRSPHALARIHATRPGLCSPPTPACLPEQLQPQPAQRCSSVQAAARPSRCTFVRVRCGATRACARRRGEVAGAGSRGGSQHASALQPSGACLGPARPVVPREEGQQEGAGQSAASRPRCRSLRRRGWWREWPRS